MVVKKKVVKSSAPKASATKKREKPAAKKSVVKAQPLKKPVPKKKVAAPVKKKVPAKSTVVKAVKKPVVKTVAKTVVKAVVKAVVKSKSKPAPKVLVKPAVKKQKPVAVNKKPLVAPKKPVPVKAPEKMVTAPKVKKYIQINVVNPLTKEQFSFFRERLLEDKLGLLAQVELTVGQLRDETPLADMIDQAAREDERALVLRHRDRESKLLKKIELALQRIEDKTYGMCLECSEPIGIERLKARLTAEQCINCKAISEVKEKSVSH